MYCGPKGVKVKPETRDIEPFSYKKLPNTHCYGQLVKVGPAVSLPRQLLYSMMMDLALPRSLMCTPYALLF